MKELLVLFVLTFHSVATAQTVVVKNKNGRIETYDASKIDSITFQYDTPGFTIYQGKEELFTPSANHYTFKKVKSIAANPDPYVESSEGTNIIRFSLKTKEGDEYNSFLVNDSTIHICLPYETNLASLQLDFEHNGSEIMVDNVNLLSNDTILDVSDFTKPHEIAIISSKEDTISRKLIVYNLPVIIIDTPEAQPIISKEIRTEGCILTLIKENGELEDLGTAGIRGRGNSTWKLDKKPYNIKLDKKHVVLGMKKSKHWLLLANAYYDRTQLHNATAFEVARMTNMPWVQSGEFVELVLNGEHKGLYYLCEKICAEKGRIELGDHSHTTLAKESGYLMESLFCLNKSYETYPFPSTYFNTGILNQTGNGGAAGVYGWEIKEPDNYTDEQRNFIFTHLSFVELLIRDSLKTGEYRDYFDLESAADWWLVEELCQNEEASRTKNVYLYKSSGGGKISMGPPWDFDAWTFGMLDINGFVAKNTAMYFDYLFKDPIFVEIVKKKWEKYKKKWEEVIPRFIDNSFQKIQRSALRNEKMWKDWHEFYYYGEKNYREIIDEMKESFLKRLLWMDQQISNFEE